MPEDAVVLAVPADSGEQPDGPVLKQISFYLDFVSPYAYLAFEQLPLQLQGLSYSVQYVPMLYAALL